MKYPSVHLLLLVPCLNYVTCTLWKLSNMENATFNLETLNSNSKIYCGILASIQTSVYSFKYDITTKTCSLYTYDYSGTRFDPPVNGDLVYRREGVSLSAIAEAAAKSARCTDLGYTWSAMANVCFKISFRKYTSGLANLTCQRDNGGLLLRVTTLERFHMLANQRKLYDYWLGGTETENGWFWSNGMPIDSTFWDTPSLISKAKAATCIIMSDSLKLLQPSSCAPLDIGYGSACEIIV